MLIVSYFWPDYNYYVKLAVLHTSFQYKEVAFIHIFPQTSRSQILNYQILDHIYDVCRERTTSCSSIRFELGLYGSSTYLLTASLSPQCGSGVNLVC